MKREEEMNIENCTEEQLQPLKRENPQLQLEKHTRDTRTYMQQCYSNFGIDYSSGRDFSSYNCGERELTASERIAKGYQDQLVEDIHKFEFMTSKRPNVIFLGIEAFLFLKGKSRDLQLNSQKEETFQGIKIEIDYLDKKRLNVGYLLNYK